MNDASITTRSIGSGSELASRVARVGAIADDDAWIARELLVELPVADVDRVDACRAALEQAVREAARRRTEVRAHEAHRIDLERVERARELHAAARDVRQILARAA
jgi:hypothetical protein